MKRILCFVMILVFISGCSTRFGLMDEIEKIINDPDADRGDLSIDLTLNFYSNEKIATESIILDKEHAIEELRMTYKYYTEHQIEDIIRFYTEYNKLASAISSVSADELTGEYIGIKDTETSFTTYIFVYTFKNIPNEIEDIDFEFINKFFNESELIKESSVADERQNFFHSGNYLVSVSGRFNEYLDEIKSFVVNSI